MPKNFEIASSKTAGHRHFSPYPMHIAYVQQRDLDLQASNIVLETHRLVKWVTDLTVKILKIGTPEIITIIVLQLEQLDFTVQYCVQKMQTE